MTEQIQQTVADGPSSELWSAVIGGVCTIIAAMIVAGFWRAKVSRRLKERRDREVSE